MVHKFNFLLISSWITLQSVAVIPKYLICHMFSKAVLEICMFLSLHSGDETATYASFPLILLLD
jgi:hypothetical protein